MAAFPARGRDTEPMTTPVRFPRVVRIAIVNDYELVAQGVRSMLRPWADKLEVVELDANMSVSQPVDIALYDTFGQDQTTVQRVRQHLADIGVRDVVVYAWQFTPEQAQKLLEAGVSGVVSKRLPGVRLAEALLEVAQGRSVVVPRGASTAPAQTASTHGDWPGREFGLTMREAEMIAMITQGLTNAEIARRAYLSGNTVKSYIRTAYRKIGVSRRSQAVAWGMRHRMQPQVSRTLDPAGERAS